MWTLVLAVAGPLINLVAKLFGGGDTKQRADDQELGQLRQKTADHVKDMDIIHDANVAGKAARQETSGPYDPNDLDAPKG